jgi:toxin-antitoxin system PIN domain toxin
MKKASSELLLLDLNVLLALAWPNHQFHAVATKRLDAGDRWATCALTELGFIRLSSNPAAVQAAKTPAEAASLLALMVSDPLHVYIESLPQPAGKEFLPAFEKIMGSKQVMDTYLLSLALMHKATFLSFDTRLGALAGSAVKIEVMGLAR